MPKVLRIINRFNLGGPTYNVAYLTKYLTGYETMVIGGEKDPSEDSSQFIVKNLGIEPIIIPQMKRAIHPVHDWITFRNIRKIISDFKPDIVHTHASKAGTLGRLAAKKEKVPVVVHTFHGHVFHSYFGNLKTAFYKSIERKLAKTTTRIIAISEKQKHELVAEHRICPAEKVSVIPLGFDLSKFRESKEEKRKAFRKAWKIKDDEIAIGIVGRLVPIKNHELFIECLARLKKDMALNFRAFIIGDGEMKGALLAKARKLGLSVSEQQETSAQLTFTSWIREVDAVYPGLDIAALTSNNEGTPVSLIEAQAAGTPIVATKAGGTENAVKEGVTALLSETGNAAAFTENLHQLIVDAERRKRFSASSWEFVCNKFHYSRLVQETDHLYKELLSEKRQKT